MLLPGKWWIGLLPLLALWLGLNAFETERVERDLAGRADAALQQVAGEPGFSVAKGRDVSLNGWIFDEATRPAAVAAAAALPGVRRVADGLSEPPPAKPFVWRAVLDKDVLTLSGATPSPGDRAAIVAAAQKAAPQARIVDLMGYFSGAPAAFAAKAEGALRVMAHLRAGDAQLLGADLSVSGQASSAADYQAAIAQAQGQQLDAKPDRVDISPPKAASFSFQAESDGKTLVLSGQVGSEADRVALLAQAKKVLPELAPVDKLQIAAGAPARFASNAGHALRALAELKSGKASLLDNVTTLSGQARAGMDAMSVAAAVAGAQGVTLDLKGVLPGQISPYVMGAEKAENTLLLTGYYPDDEAHEKILAAAREKFADLALTDRMRQGVGAPKDFSAAGLAGLEQLARLHSGQLALRDGAVSLSGEADKAETANEVKTAFVAAMPGGYAVEARLTGASREAPPPSPKAAAAPVEAQDCKGKLTDLFRETAVRFELGSAEIRPESDGALDVLAAEAKKCPEATIEISGHTRHAGHISRKGRLSRRRAEAVVAYLVAAGVDSRRLNLGEGDESKPLAPEGSDEDRPKKRRIEFNLK